MGAGHYSRPPGEQLLPHAKGPALQALNMAELKRILVQLSHKNVKAKRSGRSRLTLSLQLPADCKLWCISLCILSLGIFLSIGEFYTHSSSTMPQERGKTHRGSAWHTHGAHRQRRQHMERALSLANSIPRQ
jgi:hypothetical protein